MSRGRGKSPGWAAFDLKYRQKQGLDPDLLGQADPFPAIASSLTPLVPPQTSLTNTKRFSSLLLPSRDNAKNNKPTPLVGHSSRQCSNKLDERNDRALVVEKLKELHPWADNSLVRDVLAAAGDNLDIASALLESMFPNNYTLEQSELTRFAESNAPSQGVWSGNTMSLADLSSTHVDSLQHSSEELEENIAVGKDLSDDDKLILERLKSVPVEPEWEEDDLYLIHRKDALKMMRSASRHSKTATNAFQRGDHVSAQHHSLKAQEEWLAAERLNAKAAKEIFSIRNSKNGLWKLDLHGLHASEAIITLQERLQQIENRVQPKRSVSPNRVSMKNCMVRSSSLESSSCMDTEKLDIQLESSRQRLTSLQVITGLGNHSRGHAAIPTAVKSYLIEHRYHYDESRPGVVTVRPKFRHR